MSHEYPIRCDFCGEDTDYDIYKVYGRNAGGESTHSLVAICVCDFADPSDKNIASQLHLSAIDKYVYIGRKNSMDL